MAETTQKYGEILGEFKTVLLLAEMLEEKGIPLKKSLSHYQNKYKNQLNSYKGVKGYKDIIKYTKDMDNVFKAAARDLFDFTMSKSPKLVDIDNTSKTNRNSVQKVKIDIELTIDGITEHISLKQYKKDTGVQLCSGTYSSTLCSLAFQKIAQGKFKNNGKEFLSKRKDRPTVKANLISNYGTKISCLYDKLILLEDSVKVYQTMQTFPGKSAWKKYCTDTGLSATDVLFDILSIISANKCLKQDILQRAGLLSNHHILVACNKSDPKVYSTLTNKTFRNNIKLLNDVNTNLTFNKKGQGVEFVFTNSNTNICSLNMPLTINRNGAWHLPSDGVSSRICEKSGGITILAGQLRPGKAKEMATSTNLWLEIKKLT